MRSLAQSPATTLTVLATLAGGIAVVTTFFSFVNSALLRPLPYTEAERIVALGAEPAKGPLAPTFSIISLDAVAEIRSRAASFEHVAAFREASHRLSLPGGTVPVTAAEIDEELLPLLRARPAVGRAFTREEFRAGAPVALVSDSLWRAQLGGTHAVLDSSVRIDGVEYTVVGVMPPGFRFYERADVWLPIRSAAVSATAELDRSFSAVGRLANGATLQRARLEVRQVSEGMRLADVRHAEWALVVRDEMVFRGVDRWSSLAAMFIGAAVFVLLVACSNVANLLLARAEHRRHEMGIRMSLGATRGRILRLQLTESLVLALTAGAVGAVLASWGITLLTTVVPTENFPSWIRFGVDARVFGFLLLLSLLTVLAFGLLPAFEVTRVSPASAFRIGGHQESGRRVRRRGRVLTIIETALATVLCVGALLMARSYRNAAMLLPGYDPEHVLTVRVELDSSRYAGDARLAYYQMLGERVRGVPGVAEMAWMRSYAGLRRDPGQATAPDSTSDEGTTLDQRIFLPENPERSASAGLRQGVVIEVVSDEYLRTLGLPLLGGRSFTPSDAPGAEPVTIVSVRLARHLWGDADPLGRHLQIGQTGPRFTVIGVSGDRNEVLSGGRGFSAAALPLLYVSERQVIETEPVLYARTSAPAALLKPAVTVAAIGVDREQPVRPIRTLAEERSVALVAFNVIGGIITALAASAIVLAVIGIVGVISQSVNRRSREFGIRLALGGQPRDVRRLVLWEGVRLAGVGVAFGLFGAVALTRVMARLLVGVSATDLLTYALAALFFLFVAVLATWMPARRASSVQPGELLRAL